MVRTVASKLIRMPYAGFIYRYMEKVYGKRSYSRKIKRGTPIIVYQMGKVGSSSIKNSLESRGIEPVFHLHRMNPDNIEQVRLEYINNNRKPLDEWLGTMLYANIVIKGKRAKFITLVREPIDRNVSAFFQNFGRFTGADYNDTDLAIQDLFNTFIEQYRHEVPLIWFDVEINQTLGIDVFEYPFPKEKGYLSMERGNFKLLILKLEIDDSVKERAISEFLGVSDFKLIRSNIAQEKSYATMYADFTKKLELPESYVEIMCDSEYTKHFYSDAEIEAIRSKWRNRVGKNELPDIVHEKLLKASSRVLTES